MKFNKEYYLMEIKIEEEFLEKLKQYILESSDENEIISLNKHIEFGKILIENLKNEIK